MEEIKVSEDESVSADTTLLTLTETTQSVKYLEALAEREAYAETLQKLIELSGSGSVKAEMMVPFRVSMYQPAVQRAVRTAVSLKHLYQEVHQAG